MKGETKTVWQQTEKEIRQTASYIWDRPATTRTIAGVKCDCVLEVRKDYYVVVEITEERSLDKVRRDIEKLKTVKSALFAKNKYSECYFVMRSRPTDAMRSAGEGQNIQVMSVTEFRSLYFDYPSYVHVRSEKQFGSLVDSETGKPEENTYINVSYIDTKTGKSFDIGEIIRLLKNGRKIVLKGDFGAGKSRCIKQIFDTVNKEERASYYTIAVNLREYWGLKRGTEILGRHFDELGLNSQNFLKSYTNENVIYLLDGFDEIGTQLWTTDVKRMRHAREVSVSALKDLVQQAAGGVLISGREYYFNSDEEMLSAFGLSACAVPPLILECKNEFTDAEIQEYLRQNCGDLNVFDNKDIQLPEWLPRRPFIIQLVLKCAPELLYVEYSAEDIWDFWQEFLSKLCEREAKINAVLNPDTIRQILILLAKRTRTRKEDTGPLTLKDLSDAFEEVMGMQPNDESSIMLQRLPGIGRINADSPDRQFLDGFILNGLRAENLIQTQENNVRTVLDERWENAMDLQGCTILAAYIQKESKRKGYFLNWANQAAKNRNYVLAADIVSGIALLEEETLDYKDICIQDAHFRNLIWDGKQVMNLSLSDSIIEFLDITSASFGKNVEIKDCIIGAVMGISSEKGIPAQFQGCEVEKFETISTMSRIKRAKLSMPQKILVAIIKKVFFQPGRGRKEETLLRGFGESVNRRYAEKILNRLLSEGIVERYKGDEGYVYKPVRDHTKRMDAILTQLTMSEDNIWAFVSRLEE